MFSILQLLSELLFLTGQIRLNSSFPEPLPKEEEQRYILLAAEGDEDARRKLIEHNLRLVAHIAKKYAKSGIDTDDIISIGTIGLIKAVSSFKPERGALATYASKCIDNEILMSMRSERKRNKNEIYLEDPVGHDSDGNVITLIDKLGSDPDAVSEQAFSDIFRSILRRLSEKVLNDRERRLIELRYNLNGGRRLTQREVAEFLGISRSYVSRIEKKALEKLKAELEKAADKQSV